MWYPNANCPNRRSDLVWRGEQWVGVLGRGTALKGRKLPSHSVQRIVQRPGAGPAGEGWEAPAGGTRWKWPLLWAEMATRTRSAQGPRWWRKQKHENKTKTNKTCEVKAKRTFKNSFFLAIFGFCQKFRRFVFCELRHACLAGPPVSAEICHKWGRGILARVEFRRGDHVQHRVHQREGDGGQRLTQGELHRGGWRFHQHSPPPVLLSPVSTVPLGTSPPDFGIIIKKRT